MSEIRRPRSDPFVGGKALGLPLPFRADGRKRMLLAGIGDVGAMADISLPLLLLLPCMGEAL